MGLIRDAYSRTLSRFYKKKVYFGTSVSITDDSIVEIDNCRRIVEYNDVYIRIKTATVTVSVWGRDLIVNDFNTDGIVINGKISSVEFEREGRNVRNDR